MIRLIIEITMPAMRDHGRRRSNPMPTITPGSDDERRAGQADDRHRDGRFRIAARTDNAGGAAEDENHQQRQHHAHGAEGDLDRAEHFDMRVHRPGFYTVQIGRTRCLRSG